MAKKSFLHGKAESIAVLEAQKAMSICGISGGILPIRETIIRPQWKWYNELTFIGAVVVRFGGADLEVIVTFHGIKLTPESSIYWTPSSVCVFHNGLYISELARYF